MQTKHIGRLMLALLLGGTLSPREVHAAPLSDELLIKSASGTTLFDTTIPEVAGTSEPALIYQAPSGYTDTSGWWMNQMGSTTRFRAVGLLEPANEPPTPGETQVTIPGHGVLSDLVVVGTPSGGTTWVGFLSDGHPVFTNSGFVQALNALETRGLLTYQQETGSLQDVSSALGLTRPTDPRVQVLSAVTPVPVPAASVLFGSGLTGLLGLARRRRFREARY